MSDSIKQLLAEMEVTAQGAEDSGDTIAASWFRRYKTRLEDLIGEPVAYMHVSGNAVLTTGARNRNADMSGNHFDYTIPLYRLDGEK